MHRYCNLFWPGIVLYPKRLLLRSVKVRLRLTIRWISSRSDSCIPVFLFLANASGWGTTCLESKSTELSRTPGLLDPPCPPSSHLMSIWSNFFDSFSMNVWFMALLLLPSVNLSASLSERLSDLWEVRGEAEVSFPVLPQQGFGSTKLRTENKRGAGGKDLGAPAVIVTASWG